MNFKQMTVLKKKIEEKGGAVFAEKCMKLKNPRVCILTCIFLTKVVRSKVSDQQLTALDSAMTYMSFTAFLGNLLWKVQTKNRIKFYPRCMVNSSYTFRNDVN